jgi:hypothetical protein
MTRFAYQPRPISFLELWRHGSWRIKLYGIAYGRPAPEAALVDRARGLAKDVLEEVTDHYGVGFVGVHQGKTAHFIFVDWWARENELNHRVFVSEPDAPMNFVDQTASGVMACVWDLAVIGHERNAWIETVMKSGAGDPFEAYLARRLQGEF